MWIFPCGSMEVWISGICDSFKSSELTQVTSGSIVFSSNEEVETNEFLASISSSSWICGWGGICSVTEWTGIGKSTFVSDSETSLSAGTSVMNVGIFFDWLTGPSTLVS